MADLIGTLITANWPLTDGKLAGYTGIDYIGVKASAVQRAKIALYGETAVPADEDEIPEPARYWIADKATVLLIPVGIDYYMNQTHLTNNLENSSISYYDKVNALTQLKEELDAACRENLDKAKDAINAGDALEAFDASPEVSTAGLLVDPTARAFQRGPWS